MWEPHRAVAIPLDELRELREAVAELERQLKEARQREQTERTRANLAEESARRAWRLAWSPQSSRTRPARLDV